MINVSSRNNLNCRILTLILSQESGSWYFNKWFNYFLKIAIIFSWSHYQNVKFCPLHQDHLPSVLCIFAELSVNF